MRNKDPILSQQVTNPVSWSFTRDSVQGPGIEDCRGSITFNFSRRILVASPTSIVGCAATVFSVVSQTLTAKVCHF